MVNRLEVVQIITTPELLGGKPCLEGRRISVQQIVEDVVYGGWNLEQMEDAYGLRPAEVYAALSYYYDHQPEIDRRIQEEMDEDRHDQEPAADVLLQFLETALSTAQAAERLGISERAVRQLIESGTLPARKFGGIWFIHPDALDLPSVKERRPGPRPRK